MARNVLRRTGVHPSQQELSSLDHVRPHSGFQAVRVAPLDRACDGLVLTDECRCIRGNQLIREHNPTGHDLERIEAVEQHLMTAMEEDRTMEAGVSIGDRNWIAHDGGLAEPVEGTLDLLLVHPRGAARLERKARRVRFKKGPQTRDLPCLARRELGDEGAPAREHIDEANVGEHPQGFADRAARGVEGRRQGDLGKPCPRGEIASNDRIADGLADRLHHRVGPLEGNQGWSLRYC